MMAFDINTRIQNILDDESKLPVAYIGKINHPLEKQVLFYAIEGGISNFMYWSAVYKDYLTTRVRQFMGACGFDYNMPTTEQIEEAYEASFDMPAYPAAGCVKKLDGVIVVKMGE
jgi:hypothetical protein